MSFIINTPESPKAAGGAGAKMDTDGEAEFDLSKKTNKELTALCKERSIKGYSKKNKQELIELLTTSAAILEGKSDGGDSTNAIIISIPDCFVSSNLKLSNGKNGHGERRLYTGDSYECNKNLTQKPWLIKYPENYIEDIKSILNINDNFAKKVADRVQSVTASIESVNGKQIYVGSQNGEKDVSRYYVGPEKSNKENVKLWDAFRNTIIPKEYYLQLVECNEYFECQIMSESTHPRSNKKSNSVSNTQMEFFKYKEKELGIEIQGAHNGVEFQLRNPENGYYWPIDGRHVCGIHKCAGNKDAEPCPYNMNVWEFQGDYFHGNPEKYSKDDKFHNVTVEAKWDKDRRKKEFYESQGYKVNVVWESDWIAEKKILQSQGKTWRV